MKIMEGEEEEEEEESVCMYVCMCVVVVVAVCLSVHREVCIPSFEYSHPLMVGSTTTRKFYEAVTVVAVKKRLLRMPCAYACVCLRNVRMSFFPNIRDPPLSRLTVVEVEVRGDSSLFTWRTEKRQKNHFFVYVRM